MKMHRCRSLGSHDLAPETLMMGFGFDPSLSEGAIKAPLFQSSTFVFQSAEDGKRFFEVAYGLRERDPDEALGLIYSRINNPNLEILEDRLAVWDKADRALVFASGMAAISTAMLALSRPGDLILYTAPAYGGTEYLFDRILPRLGVQTRSLTVESGAQALAESIRSASREATASGGRLAVVYLETPANPTNQMVDIAAAAETIRELRLDSPPVLAVDNTFLGPLWQRPLELGADLALYSLTKYVGGHSDLIAGGAMGTAPVMAQLAEMRTICGSASDPHTCWLLLRSLETLSLRMERSQTNAIDLVSRLSAHPKVKAVLTAGGLGASAEQQALARRQCAGQGSTFSIRLNGGEAEAFRLLNALRIFKLAVSLGGTESLASHPASTTHSDYSPEAKDRCGIGDDLVRLSVGIENPDDLWADLQQALDKV